MTVGSRRGAGASKTERIEYSEIFSPSELDGALEAAFLLKATGIALAGWTRAAAPQEVVSVMAATMWGSLDTMIRALGGKAPRSAYLELDDRRILALQVGPNWTLLLVGQGDMGKRRLWHEAQRILERITDLKKRGHPRPEHVEVVR